MEQLELLSIENPCINVCESDKRGFCLGCFRKRQERFDWANMTAQEKRKVLELCKQRGLRRKAKAKKQQQTPISVVAVAPDKPQQTQQESVQDMGLDLFDL